MVQKAASGLKEKSHKLGRVGRICARCIRWQWTNTNIQMVTPSCSKEDAC